MAVIGFPKGSVIFQLGTTYWFGGSLELRARSVVDTGKGHGGPEMGWWQRAEEGTRWNSQDVVSQEVVGMRHGG